MLGKFEKVSFDNVLILQLAKCLNINVKNSIEFSTTFLCKSFLLELTQK